MLRLLKKVSRKRRISKEHPAPAAAVAPVAPAFVPSEEARAEFPGILQKLLDRPEGTSYTCQCCGHVNNLAKTKRVNANCLFSQLELRRFECGGCGGIFGPMPLINCKPEELGELYGCLYKFYREGFSQPFQEKTFYLMNPSRRREYLNYACGDWTEGCERLRSLGWLIWGYEPFQRVDSTAIVTDRQAVIDKQYDGLMSHNFIEHVQNPADFFRECSMMIKPGGKMAHSSACFDYVYEVSPFHLFFYPGTSVEKLAARTGFKLLAEHRVDQDFPGYQYVCCIFEKCN